MTTKKIPDNIFILLSNHVISNRTHFESLTRAKALKELRKHLSNLGYDFPLSDSQVDRIYKAVGVKPKRVQQFKQGERIAFEVRYIAGVVADLLYKMANGEPIKAQKAASEVETVLRAIQSGSVINRDGAASAKRSLSLNLEDSTTDTDELPVFSQLKQRVSD